MIIGAAASALGQNLVGIPIARNKIFKKSLSRSFMMGAAGKKAPHSVKSLATDAVSGVVSPEVNAAKNQAYSAGEAMYKNLKLHKANKRDLVVARLSAAGDEKGLKRIGKAKSPLAQSIRNAKKRSALPSISKSDLKSLGKLSKGSRAPSSNKAAFAANAAITPLPGGASTAAVNLAKLGASTKAAGKNPIIQKINKTFVTDPIKANYRKGATGKAFNKTKHWGESVLVNPFTSEAERIAYKTGVRSISRA